LRPAREADLDLFDGWCNAFCRDCNLPLHPPDQQLLRSRQHIERGEPYFWEVDASPFPPHRLREDAQRHPHQPRLHPAPLRGRGYASACVAALSQRMLDAGRKFCFLFTDLANPTSNKIYATIGYEKVCEDEQIFFDPPSQRDQTRWRIADGRWRRRAVLPFAIFHPPSSSSTLRRVTRDLKTILPGAIIGVLGSGQLGGCSRSRRGGWGTACTRSRPTSTRRPGRSPTAR
jgi:RimJ/RimL family protein N-acetyltransferase